MGEYCKGYKHAVTPDVRNAAKNQLYDSTVDNPRDPSIFVTYHDAQAYPEYMRDPASTIDEARLTVSTRAGSNSRRRNHLSPTSTRPRINRPTASTGATSSSTSTSPFSSLKQTYELREEVLDDDVHRQPTHGTAVAARLQRPRTEQTARDVARLAVDERRVPRVRQTNDAQRLVAHREVDLGARECRPWSSWRRRRRW